MLVVRNPQLKALGAGARTRFETELADIFLRTYPRECRQAGGRQAIEEWVRSGLQAATAKGYSSQSQASRWLSLTLFLGVDFAVDPQLPWVGECLDAESIPDPGERIDLLYEKTLDYLEDTAGEDAEFVVKALLRIRKIDFSALPVRAAEDWPLDCCERLLRLYPQKFDFMGGELMEQTVRSSLARAQNLGLQGPAGEFLFVLLSFMLGSGFDHDPLHGWAARILHSDPGDDLAIRLEAAAREHLESSLKSA